MNSRPGEDQPIKWKQHLMLQMPPHRPGCIWIHACSVGEVGSVAPLIKRLIAAGYTLHLTVVTATGFAHARQLLGDQLTISFLPWDLPTMFRRFVRRLNPALLLLCETEFWPGMLMACQRNRVPIIGINTRISDRSFPRYHAMRALWRRWLDPVEMFLPQSELDGERLIAMGVKSDRIKVAGNLKYAVTPPEVDATALRSTIDVTGSRPMLLVASTHEGEDRAILDMWPTWKQRCPELLLVIVPRHPERFDAVAELINNHGLKLARWSKSADAGGCDCLLVDAMGVLSSLYTVADLVIVAGSIANVGGHNPLEPAICGRGVITGPSLHNFRDMMQQMQQAHAAIIAADESELEAIVSELLTDPETVRQLNASAAAFMQDRAAVLDRVMAELTPWLKKLT